MGSTDTTLKSTLRVQEEVIEELQNEGYDVSSRTLSYWRSCGILPPLIRDGNSYLCPEGTSDHIRSLCSARSRVHPDTVFICKTEGGEFDIVKVEIRRVGGVLKRILYPRDKGFIFRDMQEEELHAATGEN